MTPQCQKRCCTGGWEAQPAAQSHPELAALSADHACRQCAAHLHIPTAAVGARRLGRPAGAGRLHRNTAWPGFRVANRRPRGCRGPWAPVESFAGNRLQVTLQADGTTQLPQLPEGICHAGTPGRGIHRLSRHQPDHRFAAAGHRDLFPSLDAGDDFGEAVLGFCNRNIGHG